MALVSIWISDGSNLKLPYNVLDFCLPPALPFVFENYIFSSSRKSEGMIIEAKSIVFFIIYNGIIFLICPQH